MRRWVAASAVCLSLAAFLGSPGAALADSPRPTANPAEPTPVTPDPGGPPRGSAPDGSTIGGTALSSRGLVVPAGAPLLPADISAQGWVIADAGSGEVLAARDPHGRYYPASTLKLLTLLSLYPLLDPAEVVTATVEDESVEGSRVGLIDGGHYDVATLWLGLMLQSGNDAANALSRAVGGLEPTLEAMYAEADRLGAYDTSPGGPSGLDVEGQRSSPYDLALLMTAAIADPTLLAIMGTRQAQIPAQPDRDPGFQIQNENRLLADYPGAIAGKTGFTDAARHTFVAAAERDGRRLVVSLMLAEHVPIPTWQQAERLLDWGFGLPPGTPPVGVLVAPGSTGATAETASAAGPPAQVNAAAGSTTGLSSSRVLIALLTGTVVVVLSSALFLLRRPRVPRGRSRH
ncbi:MAG: serine hydrolase [Actinomycetota bacterium]|nr:serine hydrolase [Actinomycetota bacterium]